MRLASQYEYHNPADNIALAIYRSADSAQQAIDASPIRFALEKVVATDSEDSKSPNPREPAPHNASPDVDVQDLLRPSTLSTSASSSIPQTPNTNPTPQKSTPMPFTAPPVNETTAKWFQVTVDRSRAVHQDFVERQPYWKQFNPMKSMAQEDLIKTVPHPGLSDVSKRPPNQHRTPHKVLRLMSDYVDKRMVSLKGLWEAEQDKATIKPHTLPGRR